MSLHEPDRTVISDQPQHRCSEDPLKPFWGKHVAWDMEGTHILAAGDSHDEVRRKLEDLGIDPCNSVGDFVHDPNTSYV